MRKRLNITLDEMLYEKIKVLATKDHRSVSNKIECMLEECVNRGPGISSTPTQSPLYYPPGVRSPIPEPPYKITSETEPDPRNMNPDQLNNKEKPRRIIGDDPLPEHLQHTTNTTNTTSTIRPDGHKKHPLVWLDENNILPSDISESAYNKLHAAYPDIEINEFVNYQHQRQDRYIPDPNDPYDPMINNPYLKNNNT